MLLALFGKPPQLLEIATITDSRCFGSDSLPEMLDRSGCLPEDKLKPYYSGLVDLACGDNESYVVKSMFRRARSSDSRFFIETWIGKEECPAAKHLLENWKDQLTKRLKKLEAR